MSTRHGERPVEISRVTRAGRTITYSLRVIQQPERARACGSGAKSSADRRPVDPPPVVELRVFEGEGTNKEDITFGYEANFFLYASLELARPMAHGRNHPSPAAQPVPVLTGMPVSGMAYLDRPTEAGYFIFPDLSVRHEGRYKLAFNLYEQTKKDQDLDVEPSPQSQQNAPNGPHTADSSFDFRMEIKSNTFHVWSAKKFPGLKESTALSRTVAEQGCRVRIRRDVRMRRRGGEKGTEFDEAEEYRNRAEEAERESRSRSTGSSGSESPPRTNGQPFYQSQPGNNLAFIQGNSNSQFAGPPPPQHYIQSQPTGPHQHIQQQPPPQRYQQQPLQQLYSQPPPPPHNNYSHDRQHPQSAYPANAPRDNFEPEHRRASVPYPSANSRDYQTLDPNLNRPPPQAQFAPRPYNAPSQAPVNIAPIKLSTPIESKFGPVLIPSQHIAPEYPNPPRDRSGSYSNYPAAPPEPARIGSKRAHDTVFGQSTQPLYNGMRPDIQVEGPQDEDEEDEEYSIISLANMTYKRADGHINARRSLETGN